MKIEPTSLINNAKKIAGMTQNLHQSKNESLKKAPKDELIDKVSSIKQQLFSVQSSLSKQQTLSEGLKELQVELISLNVQYNEKSIEHFYQRISKISQNYRYNQEKIIPQEYLTQIYEKNLQKDEITPLIEKIAQEMESLQQSITSNKKLLMKLQVTSENIFAASTVNKNLLKELQNVLKPENIQLMQKVHKLNSGEQFNYLLK